MSDFHKLGAFSKTDAQIALEGVDPKFVEEGLIRARQKSWEVFKEIREGLKEGMTELEARRLTLDLFKARGVTRHWHQPYIRFGAGTLLTFNNPLQPDYHLKSGDAVYIDLGPVWSDEELGLDYEGDVGDSFAFGHNPESEKAAAAARQLFEEARKEWREKNLNGEQIYAFLKTRTEALGYRFEPIPEGHRVADFPHQKYSRESIAGLTFHPSRSIWVLEVQLAHPTLPIGAFYEDLL